VATLTASWDAPVDKNGKPQADVIAYRVQWKRGDNEWVNVPETGSQYRSAWHLRG
jgi:hypothetical protein